MDKKFQQARFFTPWRLAYFAILALAGVVYVPALSGMLISDDLVLVSGAGIGGGDTLAHCFTHLFLHGYFRPLVSVSFFLENRIAQQTPIFYHQTNIILHILTTGLLISLLRLAFPQRRRIALIGGLLFAVQPVQVGAVAWIGGRTDALCALWMVGFAYALVRAVRAEGRWDRSLFLAVSVAAYAGAILTKEQVFPALLLVPLAFRCFSPNDRKASRRVIGWSTLPFVLVAVAFLVMYVIWGPSAQLIHRSLGAQLAQGGRTIAYYTLLLLLPTPRWMHTFSLGTLEQAGIVSVLAGYAVLIACAVGYRRWLRTEPAAAWFLAFICLTLFLVSNLIPLASIAVAPYRAGVAGLGMAALLGWTLGSVSLPVAARRPAWNVSWRFAAGTALLIWTTGLTVWGVVQWKNPEVIFGDFVRYDPSCVWARCNMTTVLLNAGQTDAAIIQLEEIFQNLFGSSAWRKPETALPALRTRPEILIRAQENQGNLAEPKRWLAMLYAELGSAYLDRKELPRALTTFQTGEAIYSNYARLDMGLGDCAYREGDYRTAKRWLSYAIAIEPKYAEAHIRLGQTYVMQGDWKAAYQEYAICVRLEPAVGAGYLHLAEAQVHLGDRAGAEATLERAALKTPLHDIALRMTADLRSNRTPNFDVL